MLDKVWEHGTKILAIGSILCLSGYMALRRRIWKAPEPTPLLEDSRPPYVLRICLTGGPCAGKTTAMDLLYGTLTEQGINTYIVPEVIFSR